MGHIKKLAIGVALVSSMLFAAVPAMAQEAGTAMCEVNGQPVPCDQLAQTASRAFGGAIVVMLIMLAISIWAFVFWILMIVHVAQHNVENKAMWIVLMVLTGIIGSIIYYFIVKRPMSKMPPTTPAAPMAPPMA